MIWEDAQQNTQMAHILYNITFHTKCTFGTIDTKNLRFVRRSISVLRLTPFSRWGFFSNQGLSRQTAPAVGNQQSRQLPHDLAVDTCGPPVAFLQARAASAHPWFSDKPLWGQYACGHPVASPTAATSWPPSVPAAILWPRSTTAGQLMLTSTRGAPLGLANGHRRVPHSDKPAVVLRPCPRRWPLVAIPRPCPLKLLLCRAA